MARVLVTGCTGFLGKFLPSLLVAHGHEVHIAGIGLADAEWPAPLPQECTLHEADLLSTDGPGAVILAAKPSHLIHLAWYVEPGQFWHSPKNLDWVAATLRLFRTFAETGGERFVGAGTCAEYDWAHHTLSPERTPLAPATLYGEAKARTFQLLSEAARQAGVSFAWGRIFFPFGPWEHPNRLLPQVIRGLLLGQPVDLSEGTQVRDFIYSEDAAALFADLADAPVEGAVNIASGRGLSIRAFLDIVREQIGRDELLRFGARSSGNDETPYMVADTMAHHSGWRKTAEVGLKQGITHTIAWWRDRLRV